MNDFETLNEFYAGGGRLKVSSDSELYKKVHDMSERVNPLVVMTNNSGYPLEATNGSTIYKFELNDTGKNMLIIEKVRRNKVCQAINRIIPVRDITYDFYATRLGSDVDKRQARNYNEFGKRIR